MKAPPGAAEGGVKMPPGEGGRKEVAAVKVILEGDPKEIAALVLAVQERQKQKFIPYGPDDGGAVIGPLEE